jgi:lysophospholipase L1-like esterase
MFAHLSRTRGGLAALAAVTLSTAAGLVAGPPTVAYAAASPRIMVVGDSISQGLEGDYTWRYRLWQHLNADGLTPQFVGPWTGTTRSGPYTGASDPYHDGDYRPGLSFPQPANLAEWGWMMAEAKAAIAQQMKNHTPDYLLVELGFNDIAWNLGDTPAAEVAASVIGSMQETVTNARAVNPNVRILLADVPHRSAISSYPELPGKLDAYNSRLDAGIAAVNNRAPNSPGVVRVGFDGLYRYATDSYDGLHPNTRGEYVIAKAFADKLSTVYGIGSTMTVPSSVPANLTPAATGTITAKVNSDWSTTLSWPHVFGAGGFWIWVRDRTNGETEFQKLPWPVGSDGWKAEQQPAGHQIDFKVQTTRGDYSSGFSPTTSITAKTLPAVNFTVTPGKYAATISWTPVAGADDYHIYAGGDCADPIPGVNDNMQLVQWSLGGKTSFTHTYVMGLCNNYYVVASKNGGEGAKPGFATRVWPIQDNLTYAIANKYHWQDTLPAADAVWRGSVAAGTDRGILMMRGFIANNSSLDALIGDHRQWTASVGQSAKVTIVWNTKTGAVAIQVHQSCLFGNNGWQCKNALPIAFVSDAYHTAENSTDYRNLFTLAKTSDGGLSVGVSAVNAWSPTFRTGGTAVCISTLTAIDPAGLPFSNACGDLVNLGRISDQITATPSGGTFSVRLVGDKYPSWEFYRYPVEGTLGSLGIEKTIGTRGQTVVTDLRGSAVTCTSPSGEIDPNGGARAMSCS